jgi:hypothetical protein
MPRSRSAVSAGRALAALALFAGVGLSEATYYGRYNRYGGTAVVRTTTVVRRPRYGWGRRLLRDDPAEAPLASALETSAPAPGADEDEADCLTVLDVVQAGPSCPSSPRPWRSCLASAPPWTIRRGPTRFSRPTDDAVEELLKWGGFVEKAKGIDEMLGDVPLTALIVAYHAVPNATIFSPGLAERGGDACRRRRQISRHRSGERPGSGVRKLCGRGDVRVHERSGVRAVTGGRVPG